MLRNALTTSSRALRSASSRAAVRTPAVRQFAPAPAFRPAFAPQSRWYSEQTDAKKEPEATKTEDAAKKDEPAAGEAGEVAELKKKLEAKEKEVLDWKVRILP